MYCIKVFIIAALDLEPAFLVIKLHKKETETSSAFMKRNLEVFLEDTL